MVLCGLKSERRQCHQYFYCYEIPSRSTCRFFEESKGILPMQAFNHSILFHDLPNQLPYNAIVIGSETIEKKIKKLLEEGNIFPNSSPHGSPMFIIPENK